MAERRRRAVPTAAQPTLMDVAAAAGVSRQTVSNVLHAPDRVRPATRERVARFIAELGYQPNRVAQDLRASASRMIGYRIRPLAPGALASIHDRFLHALAEAGRAADHHLLLFTADDPEAEVECAARLRRSGGVAGVVLYDVTAAAVDHLVHRGHRRIGFIGWPPDDTIGTRRAQGWRAAVERHGLTAECRVLDARGADTVAAGAEMAYALLGRPEPPTAFVTATDTLAVGALRAAQQWGLEVGRDVAIVGFDDTPTAAALDLSSVRQPIEQVGRQVMATLLHATVAPPASPPPSERLLTPRLIIRASSASPAPPRR